MRYSLFYRTTIAALTLSAFFTLAPSPARAETFTLPPQLKHDGLQFASNTLFDKPLHLPTRQIRISFLTPKKLTIKPEISKGVENKPKAQLLESIIITPAEEQSLLVSKAITPTPTMYLTPTLKKTNTLKTPSPLPLTPIPTALPSPTTPPPSSAPAAVQVSSNPGGLDAEKLFAMSNAYRQSKGLPALQKDSRACELAASRAPEINAEVAGGHMHSGLRDRNLPYWNTENIITMNSEEAAFNWWINDTIHREAIEGNYTYSCVACSGNACAQEFTNFQPR